MDRVYKRLVSIRIHPNPTSLAIRGYYEKSDGKLELYPFANEFTKCCVCGDRERTVTFRPCGHSVCCERCIEKLGTCPACMKRIEKITRRVI